MHWLSLTGKHLELLGRLTGVMVGSLFSPMMPMLTWVMKPYIDLSASPFAVLMDFPGLVSRLHAAGPSVLVFQVMPEVLLCGLAGIIFMILSGQLGLHLTRIFLRRTQIQN